MTDADVEKGVSEVQKRCCEDCVCFHYEWSIKKQLAKALYVGLAGFFVFGVVTTGVLDIIYFASNRLHPIDRKWLSYGISAIMTGISGHVVFPAFFTHLSLSGGLILPEDKPSLSHIENFFLTFLSDQLPANIFFGSFAAGIAAIPETTSRVGNFFRQIVVTLFGFAIWSFSSDLLNQYMLRRKAILDVHPASINHFCGRWKQAFKETLGDIVVLECLWYHLVSVVLKILATLGVLVCAELVAVSLTGRETVAGASAGHRALHAFAFNAFFFLYFLTVATRCVDLLFQR